MSKIVKVGIAEDQNMFRAGLIEVLNAKDNVQVTVAASNGKELINLVRGNVPDIIFMDYKMPDMNGMEATQILKQKYEDIKIVMLSNYDDEEFVTSSIARGAVGYITKEEDAEEIYRAIDSVISTGYYLNDRTSKLLIGNLVNQGAIKPKFGDEDIEFSDKEIEVIRLMAKEYTTRENADLIHRGVRTVENYRASIMEKTGAKNACGIIMFAVKNGIVEV